MKLKRVVSFISAITFVIASITCCSNNVSTNVNTSADNQTLVATAVANNTTQQNDNLGGNNMAAKVYFT